MSPVTNFSMNWSLPPECPKWKAKWEAKWETWASIDSGIDKLSDYIARGNFEKPNENKLGQTNGKLKKRSYLCWKFGGEFVTHVVQRGSAAMTFGVTQTNLLPILIQT